VKREHAGDEATIVIALTSSRGSGGEAHGP
jgi:hypothetical protein